MMRPLRLGLSLLLLGPLGACSADATGAAPGDAPQSSPAPVAEVERTGNTVAPVAPEQHDRDEPQTTAAEAPESAPAGETEGSTAGECESSEALAAADERDDANAEPITAEPALAPSPLALQVAFSEDGFALGIEGEEAPGTPPVAALVVHLAGAGVDRTERFGVHAQEGIDFVSGLPDGAYRYEVTMEREVATLAASADARLKDAAGRTATDPAVQARVSLSPLPRASGSFHVEHGVLIPPTVEPLPAANEFRGTP